MIVYTATIDSFRQDVERDILVDTIVKNYRSRLARPAPAEVRAWKNSLDYMYKALNDRTLPDDAGVAIEFKLPGSNFRVDFIVSGRDTAGQNNVVIIELKQWESAKAVPGAEGVVETFINKGQRMVTHPSYQAWSYAAFCRDYNVAVQETPIALSPCVYLHNYIRSSPDDLLAPQYSAYTTRAPAFMRGEIESLRDFIKRYIHYGDNKETLYLIDHSEIRPSKSLQDLLASLLKGNQEFILIDSQRLVFDTAMIMAAEAKSQNKKKVLIVEGGPGTGKSVVAINLLVRLTRQDMLSQYVTKNATPRHVYEARLTGTMQKSRVSNLFQNSSAYVDAPANSLDVLITDEAHRLTDKSGLFRNKGEDQIKEIINAAHLSVFFIDESQRVTTTDFGSVDKIRYWARRHGAEISHMFLDSQFRCNGSDGYITWLDDVLAIRPTAQDTSFLDSYDFQVFDNPEAIRDIIYQRNQERNKARMLAGYCWNWEKDKRNNPDHADIELPGFDFKMSWNLNNTNTWAIDPQSVDQIGCIHTSQGLEFDYVGVIIGPDLRYENERIVTDHTRRARTDQSLKGIKKMYKRDPHTAEALADEIIKNTYRTLLTRGMKGCYVYCTDKALADYLRYRLSLPTEQSVIYEANDNTDTFKVADTNDK